MNDFSGKELLAAVRGKDYAHAGEEEAIRLMFDTIPRQAERKILDAGCGRGGTADFVQKNGWGKVTGIDIEGVSIEYAQKTYPQVDFHVCDVTEAGSRFSESFQLIYLFNSFYAFQDKAAAAVSLRKAARPGARLCIFDYVCYKPEVELPEVLLSGKPAAPEEFVSLLTAAHWEFSRSQNLDLQYVEWYRDFLDRVDLLAAEKKYPAEVIEQLHHKYRVLLSALERKTLGGTLLVAYAN